MLATLTRGARGMHGDSRRLKYSQQALTLLNDPSFVEARVYSQEPACTYRQNDEHGWTQPLNDPGADLPEIRERQSLLKSWQSNGTITNARQR